MLRGRLPTALVARALRHRIVQNAFALYWVQFATFVVPFVTLPYITRVLGARSLGIVILAQGLAGILTLVIDFGFYYSAARDVAFERDDPDAVARIVAGVLGAKLLLSAAALALAFGALLVIATLRDNPRFVVLAWVVSATASFGPTWFFIGIESVRLASVVQLGARAVAAVFTFVLVHGPGDGWRVLALTAVTSAAASALLTALMFQRVPVRRPRWPDSVDALRRGWTLSVSSAAVALYTTANVVILGLFAPAAQVAHFGLAERVVRAATQLVAPISQAVHPRISYLQASGARQPARRLTRLTLLALGTIGVGSSVLLIVLAPLVISLISGPGYRQAVPILRILAVIVPLISLSTVLGTGWMLSLRMDRDVVRTVLLGAVVNVALAVVLAPLFGPKGMAWAVVAAELTAFLAFAATILRRDARTPEQALFLRPRES